LNRGIRLSRINAKLQSAIDLTPFLGKLQQHGIVKIVFDPVTDEEPFVQLTEKGRQEIFELLFSDDTEVTTK
jgi:DNA-binding MarR family transcriptional regulator